MSTLSTVGEFPIAKNPNDPFLAQSEVDRMGNALEGILAGLASISVAGGVDVTVDTALDESPVAAAFRSILLLTGTLTANINLILPNWAGKYWFIYNGSSGAYTITVKVAGQTGVQIAQGFGRWVFCNGTDIQEAGAGVSTAGGMIRATVGPNGTQQHSLPAVASDTFALLTAAQTLLNKTLTSPAIGTSLLDTNGAVLLDILAVASAVNRIRLANAATGNAPGLQPTGSDTDISFLLQAKGAGALLFGSKVLGNGNAQARGRLSKAMSDADYSPTSAEYSNHILEFTGTLTANRNITLPNTDSADFFVANLTTGGFSLTFKVSGQTGVTVAAGKRAAIYCNGTDYVRLTADT